MERLSCHLKLLYNVTMFKYINIHTKLLKLLAPCSFYLHKIVLLSMWVILGGMEWIEGSCKVS
jgi:hypothetical protein